MKKGNSPTNLYIIGNGFDLFHLFKTNYSSFSKYIKENNPTLFENLSHFYNTTNPDSSDYLWGDFEKSLELLDDDEFIQSADSMSFYGSDDYRDQSYDVIEAYVQEKLRDIRTGLIKGFHDWITQTVISGDKKVVLSDNSLFLSFNYTNTLEKVYNIPCCKILHIHGEAIKHEELIFGHGGELKGQLNDLINEDSMMHHSDNPRHIGVKKDVDNYLQYFYKNTKEISYKCSHFFDNLKTIKNICIFGHSLSSIDWEYFFQIKDRIDFENTIWYISYFYKPTYFECKYGAEEFDNEKYINDFKDGLSISPNQIVRFNTANFDEWQPLIDNKILIPNFR